MIPPRGFKAEQYPLFHHFIYSVGLNLGTATNNSTILTFVKNYKGANDPSTVIVNPHDTDLDAETGAICTPMSIIDKLQYSMHFTLTEDAIDDGHTAVKVKYMPIFTSFPHRLEEADIDTSLTVAALLELTKDATQEDVTPAFSTDMVGGVAANQRTHPVSTVNFTEVFGTLNLGTDLVMEGVPWDSNVFFKASKRYTNKGALNSCHGNMRTITLTKTRPTFSVFSRRFVPRDVRRIVPYSYLGMLLHLPIDSDIEQPYYSGAVSSGKAAVGVKAIIDYHEWNPNHNQDVTA